ncbi:MAG: hypothetical protein WA821_14000 [Anaerolineales bacterium]
MSSELKHGAVPPFFEETPPGPPEKTAQIMRPAMMVVGAAILLISMLGAGKLLVEILISGPSGIDTLGAKLLWIAIPFLVGWIVSLIDIRVMNSLVLPLIIRGFIWLTLFGILSIYVRIINRLYTGTFTADHYLRYSLVLAVGFAALVGLHLLIEDHDLRPYSIPILIMALIHLLVAVVHYVFQNGNPAFAVGDMIYFFLMLSIFILMVLHLGLLNPLRRTVDRLVQRSG